MSLFGSQPRIGVPFYIGSTEVFSKKLSYLAFNLEWQAPPEDLYDHYRVYFDSADNLLTDDFRRYFTVDIDLLYDRTWNHSLCTQQKLFAPVVTEPQRIGASSSAIDSAFAGHAYEMCIRDRRVRWRKTTSF